MSPIYAPAFRISKRARVERQRARRQNVMRTYTRGRDGTYRCSSCGVERGQPHRLHCAP